MTLNHVSIWRHKLWIELASILNDANICINAKNTACKNATDYYESCLGHRKHLQVRRGICTKIHVVASYIMSKKAKTAKLYWSHTYIACSIASVNYIAPRLLDIYVTRFLETQHSHKKLAVWESGSSRQDYACLSIYTES